MFQGGSIWKPPPLKRMKPPPLPELQEIVKKGQLSSRFVILADYICFLIIMRTIIFVSWCLYTCTVILVATKWFSNVYSY